MDSGKRWGFASFEISTDNSDAVIAVAGRDRWALEALIAAGTRGCTPIVDPAPRRSGYVHNLRGMGVVIETIHEKHEGPFPGTHARYLLRSNVSRLQDGEAEI